MYRSYAVPSNIHNPKLRTNAQHLRKEMTKEERHLWYDFLKLQPFNTHRQKVFGHYIVDFYIASAKIVIELDGSQHYAKENRRQDQERDAFLQSIGIKVLRYSNADVNQRFRNVCEDILFHVNERRHHACQTFGCSHPPQGENIH